MYIILGKYYLMTYQIHQNLTTILSYEPSTQIYDFAQIWKRLVELYPMQLREDVGGGLHGNQYIYGHLT